MNENKLLYIASETASVFGILSKTDSETRKVLLAKLNELLGKESKYDFNMDFVNDGITEVCMVAYDGGRHPEYNSTMYNTVYGVLKKKGKFYVNTEEDSEYPMKYLTTAEVYGVVMAMIADMQLRAEQD
jgi:hypothetical protein